MTDGNDHPILTAVGVVAVALGVLMVIQPGLAAAIGTGYGAVTVVGLLALVQAVQVARGRHATDLDAAETDDVETVETMPTPGDEFDRKVAELRSGPRRVLIRERSDLRTAIEEAAVTAVADRENCSREAARERIEAGTWTDDPHAATFLGGADAPSPPLFDRFKLAARTESPFQFRLRRTADAVARAAGVESGDEDDGRSDGGDSGGGATDGGGGAADGRRHERADDAPVEGTDPRSSERDDATDGAPSDDRADRTAAKGVDA